VLWLLDSRTHTRALGLLLGTDKHTATGSHGVPPASLSAPGKVQVELKKKQPPSESFLSAILSPFLPPPPSLIFRRGKKSAKGQKLSY